MDGVQQQAGDHVAQMDSVEGKLSAVLNDTADDVAHVECFDTEQRAEIYTILKTLEVNSETHRAMVKLLCQKARERQGNA